MATMSWDIFEGNSGQTSCGDDGTPIENEIECLSQDVVDATGLTIPKIGNNLLKYFFYSGQTLGLT